MDNVNNLPSASVEDIPRNAPSWTSASRTNGMPATSTALSTCRCPSWPSAPARFRWMRMSTSSADPAAAR